MWLNDGSCLRLRPQYTDHVWSYDFMQDRTHNGTAYRILNIIDEFSRECLCCRVARTGGRLDPGLVLGWRALRQYGRWGVSVCYSIVPVGVESIYSLKRPLLALF